MIDLTNFASSAVEQSMFFIKCMINFFLFCSVFGVFLSFHEDFGEIRFQAIGLLLLWIFLFIINTFFPEFITAMVLLG